MDTKDKKSFFFQPADNKRWWQFRKMDRREYGYTAVLGLLAGFIFHNVIGDTLAFLGGVCGIIWIVKTVKKRKRKIHPYNAG